MADGGRLEPSNLVVLASKHLNCKICPVQMHQCVKLTAPPFCWASPTRPRSCYFILTVQGAHRLNHLKLTLQILTIDHDGWLAWLSGVPLSSSLLQSSSLILWAKPLPAWTPTWTLIAQALHLLLALMPRFRPPRMPLPSTIKQTERGGKNLEVTVGTMLPV